MKLRQRTVLVTGGTSGIGLEFAKQLMALGNVVIVTGRDAAKLAVAERSAPGLHTIRSDVSAGFQPVLSDVITLISGP